MSDGRPTVRQRRLGLELRQLRHACGWTLAQAAERLDMRLAALSKIETGRQRVRVRELPGFFEVYGPIDESRKAAITHLAKESLKRNWWQAFRGVVSDPHADYLSLESDAVEISAFNPVVIPGLLQTQAYARAVTEASRVWRTQEEVDQFVGLRMERQNLLTRESPPRLWVVLSELSVRQEIGGPEVLHEQLRHLTEVSARWPHVTVQVLPYSAGAHAGTDGGFTLMRFPAGPDVVCLESMRSSLYLEDNDDVSLYVSTLDHLRSSALSARDSSNYITSIREGLGRWDA